MSLWSLDLQFSSLTNSLSAIYNKIKKLPLLPVSVVAKLKAELAAESGGIIKEWHHQRVFATAGAAVQIAAV